jgi:uncharacterized membrane protein
MEEENKTVLGIGENIEGLLCYVLGWITGIIFLLIEKENKFVRFHAMQSIVVFLALFVISLICSLIPILGWIVSILIFPISLILVIFLMYKAYKGEKYKLPYIGDFAEKHLN